MPDLLYETISFICMKVKVGIRFIWMVLHKDSFWHRDKKKNNWKGLNDFYFRWFLSFPSGLYLYVESSGTTAGQTADLVSPWIAAKSGGQCLKFYYTMYGKTMGSLAIKMELSNGKSWFIFVKSGNQGMDWKKGTGNIDAPLGVSYRVFLTS